MEITEKELNTRIENIKLALDKFAIKLFAEKQVILNEKQRTKLLNKAIEMSKINKDIIFKTYITKNNEKINIYIRNTGLNIPPIDFLLHIYHGEYIPYNYFYYNGFKFKNIDTILKAGTLFEYQHLLSDNLKEKISDYKNYDEKDIFENMPLSFNKDDGYYVNSNKILNKQFLELENLASKIFSESDVTEQVKEVIGNLRNNYSFFHIDELGIIVDVIEGKDDARLAKIISSEKYHSGVQYSYILIYPEHGLYNYIDKNRIIYIDTFQSRFDEWLAFDIISDTSILEKTIYNYIKYIDNKEVRYNTYVSNENVLSKRNKILLEEKKREKEAKIIEAKNKKWKESIENISKGKPLIKNNITFYKHKFEYEGVVFDTKGWYNFDKYLETTSIDELQDFNTILNNVIKSIVNKWIYGYQSYVPYEVRTTNMSFYSVADEIRNKKSVNLKIDGKEIKLSNNDIFYYINGIRINKNEIADVLTHILCYNTSADFNKFLETISSCSLKFHKAISNGIKYELYFSGENMIVELKLLREKSKNFIVIGKEKFSIKDSNTLINNSKSGRYNFEAFIHLLFKTVNNLSLVKIKKLTEEGIERYTKALEKSKKLLDEAVEKLGVEKANIKDKNGFIVTGKSGINYFVEDESNFPVWTLNSEKDNFDSYICIIDRSDKHQMGKDALVARMYALKNDTMIADSITTLKL